MESHRAGGGSCHQRKQAHSVTGRREGPELWQRLLKGTRTPLDCSQYGTRQNGPDFLTEGDAGVTSGHHEFDLGDGDAFVGGAGGGGGNLGERSDFGSVSFDSGMRVGHSKRRHPSCRLTFSFL